MNLQGFNGPKFICTKFGFNLSNFCYCHDQSCSCPHLHFGNLFSVREAGIRYNSRQGQSVGGL
ncbi:hypothetical protein ACSBR1_022663 [Camellia fascicularis]